jgi:putative nucleotidyltransferase with HDIG domain
LKIDPDRRAGFTLTSVQAGEIRKHSVAVVDLNPRHRQQLSDALLSFYAVSVFTDGTNALSSLSLNPPGLVIVGEQVGPYSGIRFIKAMREIGVLSKTQILYIADRNDSIGAATAAGASDCLVKPYRRSLLIKTISARLNANVERRWDQLPPLEQRALKGTVEVFNNISDVIANGEPLPFGVISDACEPLVEAVRKNEFKAILNGVKDHDNYSYAHSLRVATLLSLFGLAAGLKGDDHLVLSSGGLLHDIGKMAISHDILNKPGRLDDAEFAVMKSHVGETVKYLVASPEIPKPVITIAEQHHEKLNGLGYPNGLKGPQLNELARMAAIVDVFSALTDRRVYKAPMEAEKALGIMVDEMGAHLDQTFLKLFRNMLLDAVG